MAAQYESGHRFPPSPRRECSPPTINYSKGEELCRPVGKRNKYRTTSGKYAAKAWSDEAREASAAARRGQGHPAGGHMPGTYPALGVGQGSSAPKAPKAAAPKFHGYDDSK